MNKFDENEHPRDDDGKFSKKEGSSLTPNTDDIPEMEKSKLLLPDETFPKSVGAKWSNEDIKMSDGSISHFVEGTKLTHQEVFAGKGTKTPIKTEKNLIKAYPETKYGDWQKVKGIAWVYGEDGKPYQAELHWYQSEKTGKVEFKEKKTL